MPVLKRKSSASALVGAASLKRRPAARDLGEETLDTTLEREGEESDEMKAEDHGVEQSEGGDEVDGDPDEEELVARREEETTAARRKELKSTHRDAVKELVTSRGLEVGYKEDMIESLLAYEARGRAKLREEEARLRAVVAGKVAELAALPLSQLKALSAETGLKGMATKEARVEHLLKAWQEEDGVERALEKMAWDAREAELALMDKPALQQLCDQVGVDPFVKECIADRVVRAELAAGRFARPALHQPEEEPPESGKTMVETLLAKETSRKKEQELKQQRKEAALCRRNDLEAKSTEELKKLASKKNLKVGGTGFMKKQDLVEILMEAGAREAELAARKEHLRSMGVEGLQKLLLKNGLRATSRLDAMVEAFIAHEKKIYEELRAHEAKVDEILAGILAGKRGELEAKSAGQLKELCEAAGLKAGVSKEERIDRLLEVARQDPEVDVAISRRMRDARREALLAMDKPSLVQLCEEMKADPLVKEVMVDRILARERELGPLRGAGDQRSGRETKRARTAMR